MSSCERLFNFFHVISIGNIEKIVGTSNILNSNILDEQPSNTITSPWFPALYPRDFATEHAIQCNTVDKNATNACRIHVIFTDFQIAFDSTIEVVLNIYRLILKVN